MNLRRKFLEKVDRARDLPAEVKGSVKGALAAVYEAYEEDRAELDLPEPSLNSLKGLVRFLSHPHREDWIPPSLALNPEGHFVAIWDVVPNRYSVEFLTDDSAVWIAILRSTDRVDRFDGQYSGFDSYENPPFSISRRVAA